MIFCKSCNYELRGADEICPRCKQRIEFSDADVRELVLRFSDAVKERDYKEVVAYARTLANASHTDSEREYARMLEKGELVPRDFDGAMKYFQRAAKKADPYSAYRYSRLVSRGNERAGKFWLVYSSLLGSIDSYPETAAYLSSEGYEEDANHFYRLAAAHDDVDSIIELAKRYLTGIGVPPSSEYAKWYMEKLSFPPIAALKLVYKLRGTKAKEPPEELYDPEPLIKRSADEAARCGFSEAYFKLTEMLTELGNTEAMTIQATLLADGEGCEKNIDEAIRLLTEAAMRGSSEAYCCLAAIYESDEYSRQDPALVIRYLDAAGKLGDGDAYLKLGSIYEKGELIKRDIAKAEEYYLKAADLGIAEAKEASRRIDSKRNEFFEDALMNERQAPERAFRAYAIAAAMGHKGAPIKLADCYLKGVGTKSDRHSAFYWYKTASELGDKAALYPLGLCYAMGIGTKLNFKLAKSTLAEAHKCGSEGGAIALKKLYESKRRKLTKSVYSRGMRLLYQKKFEPARKSLELAAELNLGAACYALGCMYEFGLSVNTDRLKASICYNEAYKLGFSDTGSCFKRRILKMIK